MKDAVASGLVGVIGGIVGAVSANGIASSIPPVVDKRFDEWVLSQTIDALEVVSLTSDRVATIEDFVGQYLNATIVGIAGAYNDILGPGTSQVIWTGSPYGDSQLERDGYFGDGLWVQ